MPAQPASRTARVDTRQARARRVLTLLLALSLVLFLMPVDPTSESASILGVPLYEVPHLDKLVHVAVFAALGVVAPAAVAVGPSRSARAARSLLTALAALVAYGALVELVQAAIPGRSASAADWAADVVGALLGIALASTLARRRTPEPHAAR